MLLHFAIFVAGLGLGIVIGCLGCKRIPCLPTKPAEPCPKRKRDALGRFAKEDNS
jgi:hypothetical protein